MNFVVDKLWNFVVDKFFIWIRLGPQTNNLLSVWYNMWVKKTEYKHKWKCGAVIEEDTREGEVASSNPTGHVVRELYAKNAATCDLGPGRAAMTGGVLPLFKKVFAIFWIFVI